VSALDSSGGVSEPANRARTKAIAVALFMVGAALRLVSLDADPYCPHWRGYITDEGRWVDQARSLTLFSSPSENDLSQLHVAMAPGYQLASAVTFGLFGVDYWSARLYSAVCGVGVMALLLVYFWRRLSPLALTLGMAILSLDRDLVFLSRVAIPEMAAMFWAFLAFVVICSDPKSNRRAAMGGTIAAVAVTTKLTLAPVLGLFFLVSLMLFDGGRLCIRPRRGLAYLAGAAWPLALGAIVLVSMIGVTPLVRRLITTRGFLQPGGVYEFLSTFTQGDVVHLVNVLLLVAWICNLAVLFGVPQRSSSLAVAYFGSLIWAVGWLSISLLIEYFPGRYVLHALVPLVVHVAIGISWIQAEGAAEVFCRLRQSSPRQRAIAAIWLALPLAILTAPLVMAIGDLGGFAFSRLRDQLAVVAMTSAGYTIPIYMGWRRPAFLPVYSIFLVVAALVWTTASMLCYVFGGFWSANPGERLLFWAASLIGALFVSLLIWWWTTYRDKTLLACGWSFVAAVAVLLSVRTVPGILDRTYTIKEVAEQLRIDLKDSKSIRSRAADSLFLGNRLRYNSVPIYEYGTRPAESVVTAFGRTPSDHHEYEIVRQYEVNVYADSLAVRSHGCPHQSLPDPKITLYRLKRP
jgi:hypothetical protein